MELNVIAYKKEFETEIENGYIHVLVCSYRVMFSLYKAREPLEVESDRIRGTVYAVCGEDNGYP